MSLNNSGIKYSFKDDYSEGAHPNILKALNNNNFSQQNGYGQDDYTHEAIDLIRKRIENDKADINFVTGGTLANLIVISSILKSYESVICAETGHINTHETGAIEATGHKINYISTEDGKITPEGIKSILDIHTDEHMVKPKLVYISNSTEIGTIYVKKELEDLSLFCKSNNLLLFLDGARLGSALSSKDNDLSLPDLSKLVDVFYIGGAKNGALLGEAIVINNDDLKTDFRYHLKQRGALISKGRILGVQFAELFRENLYFDIAEHANSMASKISSSLKKLGYKFLTQSTTNQIFPILPNKIIDELNNKYAFHKWSKLDEHMTSIRLVTSWATKEEKVDELIADIQLLT